MKKRRGEIEIGENLLMLLALIAIATCSVMVNGQSEQTKREVIHAAEATDAGR